MVRISVDWRWPQCVRCLLCLCVVSPCCCVSDNTLQTLDNEMELMERTMLLKSVICQGGYVMPGVCLSVSLSVSNFIREVFSQMYLVKEELIKFWKSASSGSWSSNFFSKDSSTLPVGHFSTMWLITPGKTDRIFANIL